MKKHPALSVLRAGLLTALALSLYVPTTARAQWWADDSQPVDSPYWWTLSKSITPQQLRDALTDVERHRLRYDAEHGPVEGGELSQVTVYIDGAATPELIPMWRAFAAFAHRYEDWRRFEAEAPGGLAGHGISPAGAAFIEQFAASLNLDETTLKDEIWPRSQEFRDVIQEAGKVLGSLEDAQQLADSGDLETLAKITERKPSQLQALRDDAYRSPMAEAAPPVLAELQEKLSAKDWHRLRGYLLAEVAPGILVRDTQTQNPEERR